MRNIVLTGFMGTGKTAVGKEISRRLSMRFVDIDKEVEKAEKMPIKDIFARGRCEVRVRTEGRAAHASQPHLGESAILKMLPVISVLEAMNATLPRHPIFGQGTQVVSLIEGPAFQKKHEVRPPKSFEPTGYSDNFLTFTGDFNGDGWADIFYVPWPGKGGYWYENPAGKDAAWKQHLAFGCVDNESPMWGDVNQDGRPDGLQHRRTTGLRDLRPGQAGPGLAVPCDHAPGQVPQVHARHRLRALCMYHPRRSSMKKSAISMVMGAMII